MDELPLLELFTRLREAGVPLGIRDYEAALHALQAGYGVAAPGKTPAESRAALARLCRTLWVRSPDEQQLFDYYFEQLLTSESSPESLPSPRQQVLLLAVGLVSVWLLGAGGMMWMMHQRSIAPSPTPASSNASASPTLSPSTVLPTDAVPAAAPVATASAQPGTASPTNSVIWSLLIGLFLGAGGWWWIREWLKRRSQLPNPESLSESSPHLASELLRQTKDEIQVAQAVQQATQTKQRVRDRFILSADYLPVTQRQMKQSWRHLRQMVREGIATELDVESTVRQTGQSGILLEPVLVSPRINRTELILLVDREGSMVPFHALSLRLIETAQRGGRLGRTSVYYFHNCPVDYLYTDPIHQQAEPIPEVLASLRRDRTVVLIISDAGAARGGLNLRRVGLTIAFLRRLRRQVKSVAWLNPMPQLRWAGTTAGEIAQTVSMFEGTRQGLDQAIDALRGRYPLVTPSQEREG